MELDWLFEFTRADLKWVAASIGAFLLWFVLALTDWYRRKDDDASFNARRPLNRRGPN